MTQYYYRDYFEHIYEFFKQDELDNIKETSENKLNEILNKLDAASSKFKRDLKLDFDNFFYDFFKNRLFKTYPTLTLLNIFISLKLKENYDIVYFYDDNLTNKAKIPIIDLIHLIFHLMNGIQKIEKVMQKVFMIVLKNMK